MKKSLKSHFKGVKIQHLNAILMVYCCLLTVLIFISSLRIKSKYNEIEYAMNDYTESNKAIYDLRDASDFLTNQVRLFSINLEPEFMENYFHEYNELKRREVSVEILEMTHKNDAPDVNLKMALTESQYLSKIEVYAMKLICSAIGYAEENQPDLIVQTCLSEEDNLLNPDEKITLARSLIANSDYLASKDRISLYTNNAHAALINNFISKKLEDNYSINRSFSLQTAYITVLFVVCIVLYVLLVTLVLLPLYNNRSAIQKDLKMPMKGAFEVQYIAAAYNALCDKNAVTASVLKHKAEHDPLTGLINRNAFDQIKTALMGAPEPIAYMIIDIDLFKKINDNYGHPVGDEVLKYVATLLLDQFRSTDYVARIGGDEFAVIMTKFGENPEEIIKVKVNNLNNTLKDGTDDLPSVSLSVGVSFSNKGYIPELMEKADKALYRVKRNGRCNCAFYDDDTSKGEKK